MMNRIGWDWLVIGVVASAIFFTSLGQARLWDRDEPRNAGCAWEMLQRGELIVPIFNDELRPQKPVLLYWLIISAYQVFGFNEFAARFWSALLGVGTCVLTYEIGRRLLGREIGLLAGIILCSSVMFGVASRAATPDSALIFFSTLGIYFYVMGTFVPFDQSSDRIQLRNPGHWFPCHKRYVIAMNVAWGLAVLSKGPVGWVIPTAIIGLFLLIQGLPPVEAGWAQRQGIVAKLSTFLIRLLNPWHFWHTCRTMRLFTAITTVAIVSGPWYLAVAWQTDGEFARLFFLHENLARATTVMESHSGDWWFYPLAIAVGFFPWSVFLGPMIFAVDQSLSRRLPDSTALNLMVCWVVVQVGFFSLAETKLPSYVTPCYPALALLTANVLLKWLPAIEQHGWFWHYGAAGTLALAGLAISVGLGVTAAVYFPDIWWISLLGGIPMIGGGLWIYWLTRQDTSRSFWTAVTSCLIFSWVLFGMGTRIVDSTRQTDDLLTEIKTADSSYQVATYRCLESSWVYYAERPIFELQRRSSNAPESGMVERKRLWEKKPIFSPKHFVAEYPHTLILTTDDHLIELLDQLPSEYQVVRKAKQFLKRDQDLVLVGPASVAMVTAHHDQSNSPVR